MPRQIRAVDLIRSQNRVGSTTGNTYAPVSVPGCKRPGGPNQNVQFLSQTRDRFTKFGLLANKNIETTPIDASIDILSSMGIGVIESEAIAPNPRSENKTVVSMKVDFSLLKLETDNTIIPNARLFDKVSFHKQSGSPIFVPFNQMYKPPSELSVGDKANIFVPDDNLTNIERRKNIQLQNNAKPNLTKITQKLMQHQSKLAANGEVRLMAPHFKIVQGKLGT